MMTDLWAYRRGAALWPVDGESAAVLSKLKIPHDKPIHVTLRQPRNTRHHRLFWKLVHTISAGIGCEPEALANHLKVRAGHTVTVKTRDGIKEYPASISFAAMDQAAFSEFYNRCIDVIVTDLGIRRPDILEQVKDMIDGDLVTRRSREHSE